MVVRKTVAFVMVPNDHVSIHPLALLYYQLLHSRDIEVCSPSAERAVRAECCLIIEEVLLDDASLMMVDSNMSGPNESSSHGTPERRILGELGNSNPDSPTANLRLLTALASSLKSASDVPCQGCSSGSAAAVQLPVTQDTGCVKLLPRKEKSLSLLCNK